MATPRLGLRFLHQASPLRASALRQPVTRQIISRRAQSTAGVPTGPGGPGTAEAGGFAKLWNSNVGPKTVHFWAPVMKWALVLAGVSDFARPAESLSLTQNCALMGTGAIWTRWCFVIKPRNLFLAAVNFFLFCVGATQVSRIFLYNQSLKQNTLGEEVKSAAKTEGHALENSVMEAKGAVEKRM